MKHKISLAKTEDDIDEVKQQFYGKVGMQPKSWFPYDRIDRKAWNKLKEKGYMSPEKLTKAYKGPDDHYLN